MIEDKPLLEVFTTSWNERNTILELINFYRSLVPDCLIHVQDNMSTDDTEEVCKENNVKFTSFDTDNKMDEGVLIKLRNNSWKNSNAHYVIVCDSDELVEVNKEELLSNLNDIKWTVAKCKGVELFGNDKQFKDAKYGVFSEGYSKKVLWLRKAIKESILSPGSHTANFIPNEGFQIIYNENPPFLYHTKWMDYEYGINRQKQIKEKGISKESKSKGWNFHYSLSEQKHFDYWQNGMRNRKKVR